MKMNSRNTALANELRATIHARTKLIDDGESVAMMLLWSFTLDHAMAHGLDPAELAASQLAAFIQWARENMSLERTQ